MANSIKKFPQLHVFFSKAGPDSDSQKLVSESAYGKGTRVVTYTDEYQHGQRCSLAPRARCNFANVSNSGVMTKIVVAAISRAENMEIASINDLRIFSATKYWEYVCMKLHPAASAQSLKERSSL
jgi:hypothetical protein